MAGGAIRVIGLLAILSGLAMAPLKAEECRIGPVTVDAPRCEIKEISHSEGPARYAGWEEGGTSYTVIVITPKRMQDFKGYITRWRHHHKCTADEISFGPVIHLAEGGGKQNLAPPQKTWTGTCASPVTFIIRAVRLKRQVVELHVDSFPSKRAALEPTFIALLERVKVSPAN